MVVGFSEVHEVFLFWGWAVCVPFGWRGVGRSRLAVSANSECLPYRFSILLYESTQGAVFLRVNYPLLGQTYHYLLLIMIYSKYPSLSSPAVVRGWALAC